MKKSILILFTFLTMCLTLRAQTITQATVDSILDINLSAPMEKAAFDKMYPMFYDAAKAFTTANINTVIYDITRSLPPGYVTDGSVDYTSYIQAGLNAGNHVKLPNFPVLVNMTPDMLAFSIKSGTIVDFQLKSQLIMKPNNLTSNYAFFKLSGVSNITINNANLIGDLKGHSVPVTGNYGHNIILYGCNNITLNHVNSIYATGDGIYVARGGYPAVNSDNIIINKCICNNNGRNGISLTGCINVLIDHPICIGNNSSLPYCGIDLEPNTNLDEMKNIVINSPTFRNNRSPLDPKSGLGLSIGIKRFATPDASQNGVATLNKVVNITVNNLNDSGSGIGFKVGQTLAAGSKITVSGSIIINNPTLSSEASAANSVQVVSPTLKFYLYNPTVYNNLGVLLQGQIALLYIMHNQVPGTNIINSLSINPNPVTTIPGLSLSN